MVNTSTFSKSSVKERSFSPFSRLSLRLPAPDWLITWTTWCTGVGVLVLSHPNLSREAHSVQQEHEFHSFHLFGENKNRPVISPARSSGTENPGSCRHSDRRSLGAVPCRRGSFKNRIISVVMVTERGKSQRITGAGHLTAALKPARAFSRPEDPSPLPPTPIIPHVLPACLSDREEGADLWQEEAES